MWRALRVPIAVAGGCFVFLAVGVALLVIWARPYLYAREYLPTLERNSASLVAAIDRYQADHSRPPETLDDLVPKYIAAIPGSGYPPQPDFNYSAHEHPQEGWRWDLYVFCEPFDIFEPAELCLTSGRRTWKHSAD